MYHQDWRLLSARIQGILRSGDIKAAYDAVGKNTASRHLNIIPYFKRLFVDLTKFRTTYDADLPQTAKDRLSDFIEERASSFQDINDLTTTTVLLASFEAEITYLLSDNQEILRSRVERAFEHLKRLIVADPNTKTNWGTALANTKNGEVKCEQLGASHLLSHGIYAFKADTHGARTDLVFQQPADPYLTNQRFADGIVLTEWKVEKAGMTSDDLFGAARKQGNLYSTGALAGLELSHFRYAILVTEKPVVPPQNLQEQSYIWRHINIATDPPVPSKAK